MAPEEEHMADIEKRLDKLEVVMEQTLQQHMKTSSEIGELVSVMRVKEERERRQGEINEELKEIAKDHESRLKSIEIERATEKPAREFLSKNLPLLALLVTLASVVMASFGAKYGSSIFGG